MKVTLVNAEELKQYPPEIIMGEFAAICYDTNLDKVSPEKIIKHCIESGHGSPQRAVKFLFHIEGVSRAFSHQHVRHNVGVSHNQRSQRYCEEDEFEFVIPDSIKDDEYACEEYIKLMSGINAAYLYLVNTRIIPIEDARYVLPNACQTEINSAFDFQALVHYCNDRLCNRAQWEIRQVAQAMVDEVKKVSSMLVKYLTPKCEWEGYCREGKKCCGRKPTKEDVFKIYEENKNREVN